MEQYLVDMLTRQEGILWVNFNDGTGLQIHIVVVFFFIFYGKSRIHTFIPIGHFVKFCKKLPECHNSLKRSGKQLHTLFKAYVQFLPTKTLLLLHKPWKCQSSVKVN